MSRRHKKVDRYRIVLVLKRHNLAKNQFDLYFLKAVDHSIYVSGFSCTPVPFISVIRVILSGYRCVLLFVHSGLTTP